MQFTKLIFLATAAAGAVISTDKEVRGAQAITHLLICKGLDFSGECRYEQTRTGVCTSVPDGWDNSVNSVMPDYGTECMLFEHYECGGRSLPVKFPGVTNLKPVGFGDMLSSFKCT